MDNHPDVSPREEVERVRATSAPEDIVLVAEEEALFEEALVVHRLRCQGVRDVGGVEAAGQFVVPVEAEGVDDWCGGHGCGVEICVAGNARGLRRGSGR